MLFEFPPAIGMRTANLAWLYVPLVVRILTGTITLFTFFIFFHIFTVLLLTVFQTPRGYPWHRELDCDHAS